MKRVSAKTTSWRARAASFFVRCTRGAAVTYCLALLVLLLLENALLYPAPKYPEGDWTAEYLDREEVEFQSADGTRLHGWFVEHENPRAVLLYCHGNGDCVAYLGPYIKQLRDRHQISVFAFDYRGYGKSGGSPIEKGILADGHAAQMWLAKRTGKSLADIVIMGRSLGGCVAVDLAAKNGARGLILQNTTTTIPDAAATLYWFLPVRWLMKNRYDSLSKTGRYHGPVLMSHGTADTLVPFALGQRLFDAIPGTNKRFFAIKNGGHNDAEPPTYDAALDEFIASLP
ncbi:MAG TPA: alpha/beta hydrolase [Pirellulaceae bacterium]